MQDSQDDWLCSTQRAVEGAYSAEVDGRARDSTLTLNNAVDLTQMSQVSLTFSWFIESSLDKDEYIAVDLWDGTGWNEVARLEGSSSLEDVWQEVAVDLNSYLISDFKLRFRAVMSNSREDANVDAVRIEGTPGFDPTPTPDRQQTGARDAYCSHR